MERRGDRVGHDGTHAQPHHTTPHHTEWYQLGESSPQPPYQSHGTSTFIHTNTTTHTPHPTSLPLGVTLFFCILRFPPTPPLLPPTHPTLTPPSLPYPTLAPCCLSPSLSLSLHCIHDPQTKHARYSWPGGQHPFVPGSRGSLPCPGMLRTSVPSIHSTPLTHHRRGGG